MNAATIPFTPSTARRSSFRSGLAALLALGMMAGYAKAACTHTISGSPVGDVSVSGGIFAPSTITVQIPITTAVSGSGCSGVTVTGGVIYVELWYNGAAKYNGSGTIPQVPRAPGSLAVPVIVTISPKPSSTIICQVRHRGTAYFSDNCTPPTYGPIGGPGAKAMLTMERSLPREYATAPKRKAKKP